jgi:hypothetical protein
MLLYGKDRDVQERGVQVGHALYTIAFEDNQGMIDSIGSDAMRTINISPRFRDEYQITVIWHEVIHAIWNSWGIEHHPENLVNLFSTTIVGVIRENAIHAHISRISFRGVDYMVQDTDADDVSVDFGRLILNIPQHNDNRRIRQIWGTILYIALVEAGIPDPQSYESYYRTVGFEIVNFLKHEQNRWLLVSTASLSLEPPASTPADPPSAPSASPALVGTLAEIFDIPGAPGVKTTYGATSLSSKAPESE